MPGVDEEPEDFELPHDLPEDKLSEVLERVGEGARKVGLYFMGAAIQEDEQDEDDPEPHHRHHLMVQYSIGEIAFSDRVQNPDAEKIDDEFRVITAGAVDDDVAAIKALYDKPKEV